MDQEQIMQVQMIEQQSNQLNQQLQLIEQNIAEMQELELSLHEIDKKDSKEILANIGKRIYIPVEIKDKKLIVEVGNKNFVKKTIPETIVVIKDQTKKLEEERDRIVNELEDLQKKVEVLMEELQKSFQAEKEEEDKKED
jgi:prefoldin alpha subunit